jgi:hypothetical protein
MTASVNSQVLFRYNGVSYEGIIVSETEKAFRISFGLNIGYNCERNHNTWVPKSVIKIEKFDSCDSEYLTIKDWFIKKILK